LSRKDESLGWQNTHIGCRVKKSKFEDSKSKQYMTLQFELDGDRRIIFTGSAIIIEQMEKYKKEIPFIATVRKIDKYYTLS